MVREARIAFGGVAHRPWRAYRAERLLRGATASEDAYREAAEAELADAETLAGIDGGNGFKISLIIRTLVAVLRDLAREET